MISRNYDLPFSDDIHKWKVPNLMQDKNRKPLFQSIAPSTKERYGSLGQFDKRKAKDENINEISLRNDVLSQPQWFSKKLQDEALSQCSQRINEIQEQFKGDSQDRKKSDITQSSQKNCTKSLAKLLEKKFGEKKKDQQKEPEKQQTKSFLLKEGFSFERQNNQVCQKENDEISSNQKKMIRDQENYCNQMKQYSNTKFTLKEMMELTKINEVKQEAAINEEKSHEQLKKKNFINIHSMSFENNQGEVKQEVHKLPPNNKRESQSVMKRELGECSLLLESSQQKIKELKCLLFLKEDELMKAKDKLMEVEEKERQQRKKEVELIEIRDKELQLKVIVNQLIQQNQLLEDKLAYKKQELDKINQQWHEKINSIQKENEYLSYQLSEFEDQKKKCHQASVDLAKSHFCDKASWEIIQKILGMSFVNYFLKLNEELTKQTQSKIQEIEEVIEKLIGIECAFEISPLRGRTTLRQLRIILSKKLGIKEPEEFQQTELITIRSHSSSRNRDDENISENISLKNHEPNSSSHLGNICSNQDLYQMLYMQAHTLETVFRMSQNN